MICEICKKNLLLVKCISMTTITDESYLIQHKNIFITLTNLRWKSDFGGVSNLLIDNARSIPTPMLQLSCRSMSPCCTISHGLKKTKHCSRITLRYLCNESISLNQVLLEFTLKESLKNIGVHEKSINAESPNVVFIILKLTVNGFSASRRN